MFHPSGEFDNPVPAKPAALFADVFAQPPPRQLPPELMHLISRNGRGLASIISALVFLLLGFIFLAVGVPLTLVFFPWHIQESMELSSGNTVTASGRIISVENTSYNINRRQVELIHYSFALDGRELAGQCYFAGGNYGSGGAVQVQYLVSRPEVNCAAGGTLDPLGNFAIFFALFPLLGAGFFIAGASIGAWAMLTRGRRATDLAREGVLAEGRVTAVEQTSVRVNRQYRYRVIVSYDALGPHQMSYAAYGFGVDRARQLMAAGTPLRVLYDPRRPARALVLDHLLN